MSKENTDSIYPTEYDMRLLYAYYACACACTRSTPIPFANSEWFEEFKTLHDFQVLSCEIDGKTPVSLRNFGWVAQMLDRAVAVAA